MYLPWNSVSSLSEAGEGRRGSAFRVKRSFGSVGDNDVGFLLVSSLIESSKSYTFSL